MSRKEQSTLEFFLGRDNKKRTVAQTKGQHQCRYCSETFESTQGRGSHENAHIAKGDRIVTKRSKPGTVKVRWEPLRLRALRVRAGIVNRMIGNLSSGGGQLVALHCTTLLISQQAHNRHARIILINA